ncbi:RNA polymerase sigma-70 factor, ECF subfamily [Psychroflexus salarius]|uniref:RNA polymerase sigma-70 factor, ECF subfamily n=1 Tax=Psychroflexus salarius TaxID=1155689 RepID=A0A1M4W9V3_9FLAO|nr:RNA polymerase sigma factor [Psychroflexus salarius]SHE77987.1 RNA polymerase sigma-70 factor, ECF subfamily [Psychroflexus salarius]
MTEEEIISNLQQGKRKEEAFAALVEQHKVRLYWHIRNLVKIHEDADDVLQNTFIKVFKNIKNFKGESKLYSWMYRIATNESITFLNKKAKKKNISVPELKDFILNSLESDVYFEGDAIELKLQKAIETLPDKQKQVFLMKYFENLPYKDISEILNTSEGALKSNYHHATKKIEKYLKNN